MTNAIKSFSNKNKTEIGGRRNLPKAYVRTVHLNQTDGNFVSSLPIKNSICVYGQSPNSSNSWFSGNKFLSNLYDFGSLNFPLDAKFDFVRRKIWVVDTGNNRVLQIDYNTFLVDYEVGDLSIPCAMTINQANGDIFVRGFVNNETGVIYWMNKSGEIQDSILFPEEFPLPDFVLTKTTSSSYALPSPSTMDFDHVRNRLWWTGSQTSFMADLNTMNVSSFDLAELGLQKATPVEIEHSSGNVLIGCYPSESKILGNKRFSTILYMYKDNDHPLEIMDVSDSVASEVIDPSTQPGIEVGQTSPWPSALKFSGFSNVKMNGTWTLGGNYRGQVESYVNPNNTLRFTDASPKGQYGVGSYILRPNGDYQWQFVFYTIENYPVISEKWIYRKERPSKTPSGKYVLSSYYSSDLSTQNAFNNDYGDVTIG